MPISSTFLLPLPLPFACATSFYSLVLCVEGHDIIPNGYNLGRDWLVGNITNTTVPTLNLTNTTDMSSFSGYTWSDGWTYWTDVKYIGGLLENSSYNINHNWSVQTEDTNAVDGLVALLTVSVHERPDGSGYVHSSLLACSLSLSHTHTG